MSDIKKFLDLDGLTVYDGKIKKVISDETLAGKNADKALKTFLGNPDGYPDNNIPLYADTVNAANTAASDAAKAKAAATEAQDSAANYAASAAASAQAAANILGTDNDSSDDNTVYGVYSKVGDAVDNGLADITEAVDNGKRTLETKFDTLSGDLDTYVTDEVTPAINSAKTTAVNEVNEAKTAATGAISTDLAAAQSAISNDKETALEAIAVAKNAATDAIDEYLTTDVTSAIDGAKTTAVNEVNEAKTTALGEIAVAVKPVTDAKDAAEVAQTAAEVAQAAAEAAANTATNAVTGFRAELGSRPSETSTVWGSIAELKSATAGGVHFRGVLRELPEISVVEEPEGNKYMAYIGAEEIEFNIGDIIIIEGDDTAVNVVDEPTKEYILAAEELADDVTWVELGDVSPADQKITSLENSKLNKSALLATADTSETLDAAGAEYILVELTSDDHAVVRIGAITEDEINDLFK